MLLPLALYQVLLGLQLLLLLADLLLSLLVRVINFGKVLLFG